MAAMKRMIVLSVALVIFANKASSMEQNAAIQKDKRVVDLPKTERKIGDDLEYLIYPNNVSLTHDVIFIFIPSSKKGEPVDDKTYASVLAAQQTLKANKITLGLYTLKADSADYASISAKIQVPAIMVASNGKGTAYVSGDVTETRLLQAYEASMRAGGGSPGCGGSKGCGCGK